MTTDTAIARRDELSVEDVIAQVQKIQRVMEAVMKENEHYGKIPGVQKPSLWKPGAEKLCLTFRLDPQYESVETTDGKHLTVKSKCTLWHIPSGMRMGSGEGSCSTKESKYAYRRMGRACPKCGAEAINKSKYPPRGRPQDPPGWYCYSKVGGCGAEFAVDDKEIASQEQGRVANEDLADQYNTILKMANKRALVAAVLNVTAASDIFTQDLEDLQDNGVALSETRTTAPAPQPTTPVQAPLVTNGEATGPSYEPFGAVTMLTKMGNGAFKAESLEHYFGTGIRSKTTLDRLKVQDEKAFRIGYDHLHADYLAWKTQ